MPTTGTVSNALWMDRTSGVGSPETCSMPALAVSADCWTTTVEGRRWWSEWVVRQYDCTSCSCVSAHRPELRSSAAMPISRPTPRLSTTATTLRGQEKTGSVDGPVRAIVDGLGGRARTRRRRRSMGVGAARRRALHSRGTRVRALERRLRAARATLERRQRRRRERGARRRGPSAAVREGGEDVGAHGAGASRRKTGRTRDVKVKVKLRPRGATAHRACTLQHSASGPPRR